MKKFLALFLALVLAACLLTACGGNDASTNTNTDTDTNTNTNANDVGNTKAVLKMATNAYFQPYEYYDANNKIVGIDAEIAAAIAEKLGMELVIEDMQFNSILNSVSSGAVDFGMAGLTITDERKLEVDFSNTYATGKQVVIVVEGGTVASIDDLDGKKIGVQLGTTGDAYATGDYGMNEDETPNGNVIQYNNGNEAVLALIGGAVQAVIIDNEPAKALVDANPGKGLKILETEYVYEEYAICVKKGNTELLNKINTAIDALIADGTIDTIVNKYIPVQ